MLCNSSLTTYGTNGAVAYPTLPQTIGTCSGQRFGENKSDLEKSGLLLDKKINHS